MNQLSKSAIANGNTFRALRGFVLVGGVGFMIEAAFLTILMQTTGWTPWQARIPSFFTAVLVTWALNRTHTFAGRGLQRRSLEAFLYVAIQTCGATINLVVFGLYLTHWSRPATHPVVPLAIGAVAGFVFNFIASHTLLYARAHTRVL
jgi:putative flippase GtrA